MTREDYLEKILSDYDYLKGNTDRIAKYRPVCGDRMTDMPERLWALDAAAGERWLRCKIEPNSDAFEQTEYIRADIVRDMLETALEFAPDVENAHPNDRSTLEELIKQRDEL